MKKLLLFAVIAIVAVSLSVVGCSKDKEQDPIQWKFEVKADKDTISNLALNDIVPVTYVVNRKYNTGATMQYRVNLDKSQGFTIYDNNDNEIKDFGFQNLTSDTLKLKYKGTIEGNHSLSITFVNSKKIRVDKKTVFDYRIKEENKQFSFVVEGGEGDIYQSENVFYTLKIKDNKNSKNSYKIKFTSFDEKDMNLSKSYIKVQENNVRMNEWLDFEGKEIRIITNSHSYGNKSIFFQVTNGEQTQKHSIFQKVIKKQAEISNIDVKLVKGANEKILKNKEILVNDTVSCNINIKFNYKEKDKELFYRTWTTERSQESFVENITKGEYKKFTLDSNDKIFSKMRFTKEGVYEVNVQVKNELENESEIEKFIIYVDKKNIEVNAEESEKTITFNYHCSIKEVKCSARRSWEADRIEKNGTRQELKSVEQSFKLKLGNNDRLKRISYSKKIEKGGGRYEGDGDYKYGGLNYVTFLSQEITSEKKEVTINKIEDINRVTEFCVYPISIYTNGDILVTFETIKGEYAQILCRGVSKISGEIGVKEKRE